jgi:hypothetical protein
VELCGVADDFDLGDLALPDREPTNPNAWYSALIDAAGYVPVPLSPEDYSELLPAEWRVINSYGVEIGLRTYDSGELNPYRRQPSGSRPGTAGGKSVTFAELKRSSISPGLGL